MAGFFVTALFRHLFAMHAFWRDTPMRMLLMWSFRHTDEAECNTEPTSPCLTGFR